MLDAQCKAVRLGGLRSARPPTDTHSFLNSTRLLPAAPRPTRSDPATMTYTCGPSFLKGMVRLRRRGPLGARSPPTEFLRFCAPRPFHASSCTPPFFAGHQGGGGHRAAAVQGHDAGGWLRAAGAARGLQAERRVRGCVSGGPLAATVNLFSVMCCKCARWRNFAGRDAGPTLAGVF